MKEPSAMLLQHGRPERPDGTRAGWLRRMRVLAVAVIGGTIVLIGVALLVLPGPGLLVILAGLAVLATEFAWARWLLDRARERVRRLKSERLERPPAADRQAGARS